MEKARQRSLGGIKSPSARLLNYFLVKCVFPLGTHVKVNILCYLKFDITGLNVKQTNINVLHEIGTIGACLRGLLHVCTRVVVGFYVILCCSMGL